METLKQATRHNDDLCADVSTRLAALSAQHHQLERVASGARSELERVLRAEIVSRQASEQRISDDVAAVRGQLTASLRGMLSTVLRSLH